MKRIISVLLLATLLFTTAACLVSCGDDDDGAEISVYLTDRIYNFDPAGSYIDDATISVLHMIYEPLFTLNDDGKVKKAMADDYKFDDDTGDLIIDLRESYWTNGHRVTASDFVFAWKRIINPANSFDCAPLLYEIKNARYIKAGTTPDGVSEECAYLHNFGAVAVDSDTIRISFENPDLNRKAFLRNLSNIALAPLNRLVFENNQENYWNLTDNMTGYCNGPFRIRALNTEEGYFTLARNVDYHRPADSKKDVDHYVLPSMIRTIWNVNYDADNSETEQNNEAYLNSMYDSMAEKTVFYMGTLALDDRKDSDAKTNDALSTYSYIFNCENSNFADPTVRNILSRVINRNELVNKVTFGKAATGLISNGVWNATSSWKRKSFRSVGGELISTTPMDREEAKRALEDANVQMSPFTIYYQDREEERVIAEYVAEVWSYVTGVKVTAESCGAVEIIDNTPVEPGVKPDPADTTTYYQSRLQYLYDTRNFDVIAVDYQMFSTNALTALANLSSNYHGGKIDFAAYEEAKKTNPDANVSDYRTNIAGYSNPAYDKEIEEAMNEADLKARAEHLHAAEKILMEDMPIVPLLFNQTYYVKHKYLKKLDVNYYGFTVFTKAKLKNYSKYFFED